MSDREINIRSVLFLVVGILLVLSLVVCIYIVNTERDLIKTEATVIKVENDSDGTGKNKVTVVYDVDNQSYEYEFYYKDQIKENDKLSLYYHNRDVTSVQTFKTNKIIFVCPLIGLVLCGIGLYELLRNNSEDKVEMETQAVEVNEENGEKSLIAEKIVEAKAETSQDDTEKSSEEEVLNKPEETKDDEVKSDEVVDKKEDNMDNHEESNEDMMVAMPAMKSAAEAQKEVEETQDAQESKVEDESDKMKPLDDVAEKVQESLTKSVVKDKPDEDIKDVIKEMLKEAIKEVNEEKAAPEPVVQRKVIPNYFYISGTSLIYEEVGKKAEELNLKDIKTVVRTINSAGSIVKVVVSNDKIKCVLTNMKNIDLEQLANLLHNKMRTIDDTFKEIIERKEY